MAEEKQQIELDLEDEQDTEVEVEAAKDEEPQIEAATEDQCEKAESNTQKRSDRLTKIRKLKLRQLKKSHK